MGQHQPTTSTATEIYNPVGDKGPEIRELGKETRQEVVWIQARDLGDIY